MIRRYETRDFADVLFLQQISYLTPCTETELLDKLTNSSWVYEDESIVGCLITCPHTNGQLIWSVTVAPAYQRRGIATKLIQAAREEFPNLCLHVYTGNPAQHLYRKLGFRTERLIPNYYGPSQDALEMTNKEMNYELQKCPS